MGESSREIERDSHEDHSVEASGDATDECKYWAFISYSRTDERWAKWLHRKLEGYRLPANAEWQISGDVPHSRKISPVFLDQEEMATSSNLSKAISDALRASRHLIVVCSPRSAKSHWVNKEILIFKRLGRAESIHYFIIEGEPHAVEDGAAEACFPRAATHAIDAQGQIGEERVEPAAADVRKGKETRHDALLRLIAGILGINLAELKSRDLQRRHRRQLAVSVSSAIITLIMAALAIAAVVNMRAALAALRRETAFRLTAESRTVRQEFPQRSALLGVEAVKATRSHREPVHPRVEQNLRDALRSLGGRPLTGHRGSITALALSVDGKRLVTGSSDHTARVWDLDADHPKTSAGVLKGHQGGIWALALSANGERLATVSLDDRARVWVWDLEDQDPNATVRTLGGHTEDISALALSADGKRLVTGSHDDTARVWDLQADDPSASVIVLDKHAGDIVALALSPDGKRLVTGSDDLTARVWGLGGR